MNAHDERLGLPSASAANRWVNCPASIEREQAEKADYNPPASDVQELGTRVHAALAGQLPVGELNAEETALYERFKEPTAKLVLEVFGGGEFQYLVETRLWLHNKNLEPVMSGKPDFIGISGRDALIIDYKTGTNAPPAHDNWQLRALAVLVDANRQGIHAWHLAVIAPNAKPQVTVYKATDVEVFRWRQQIIDALEDKQTARPGPWCKYCRARASCPEAGMYTAIALADVRFTEMMDELRDAYVMRWATLPPKAKATKLALLKTAADFYEAVKERAELELAEKPDALGEWARLEPGRERRVVRNPYAAIEALANAGLTPQELAAAGALAIQLGKAEVAFANAKQAANGEKQTKTCPPKYKDEFNQVIGDMVEVVKDKPRLVIETEKLLMLP
jgi:CRISPR/Cas system-associated exonuclease Cas4 (RecB family)